MHFLRDEHFYLTIVKVGHKKKRLFSLLLKFSFPSHRNQKQWSVKTEQGEPQLHFAPTFIKIRSVVFENELNEDAPVVPKKRQKMFTRKTIVMRRMYV